jgi:hypothetical protein
MKTTRTSDRPMRTALATLCAVAVVVSCAGEDGSPFPDVEGWTQASDVRLYDADNLWEYINGAAELYVEYEVQSCATADLSSDHLTVTVDLYDMGTPLNAFGVYSRERAGDTIAVPGATVALFSPPYLALMLKGGTYVKANVLEGDLTSESVTDLLEALAAALPGTAGYPSELELLPEADRITGTEGFQRDGFLGLTELTDCLYAEYANADGGRWQGFVMIPADGTTPASVWDALMQDWETLEHGARTVLYRDIPYQGLVGVVQSGETIMGVSGAADQTEMLSRLDRFVG